MRIELPAERLQRDQSVPEGPGGGPNPTITELIDYEQFCGIRGEEHVPETNVPEVTPVELKRMMDAHRRTLDELATGVAIFGSNQQLSFYNAAYRRLWDLNEGFLDARPTDSAVLDRLRAARKLPDESDFRQWKAALHEAYRAIEAKEQMWHLPDGRTLRVVTTPNPEGGVICMAARTCVMVCSARARARLDPSSRIAAASASVYLARLSWIGFRICTRASAAQLLHSMQPMPAVRHP